MATSKLELQEVVFQVLLENLKVGEIPENHEDGLNQCFYWKEAIRRIERKRQKLLNLENILHQVRLLYKCLHSCQKKTISGNIKELEDFFDRQVSTSLKPKNNNKTNASIHV